MTSQTDGKQIQRALVALLRKYRVHDPVDPLPLIVILSQVQEPSENDNAGGNLKGRAADPTG